MSMKSTSASRTAATAENTLEKITNRDVLEVVVGVAVVEVVGVALGVAELEIDVCFVKAKEKNTCNIKKMFLGNMTK